MAKIIERGIGKLYSAIDKLKLSVSLERKVLEYLDFYNTQANMDMVIEHIAKQNGATIAEVKRALQECVSKDYIKREEVGRAITYKIMPTGRGAIKDKILGKTFSYTNDLIDGISEINDNYEKANKAISDLRNSVWFFAEQVANNVSQVKYTDFLSLELPTLYRIEKYKKEMIDEIKKYVSEGMTWREATKATIASMPIAKKWAIYKFLRVQSKSNEYFLNLAHKWKLLYEELFEILEQSKRFFRNYYIDIFGNFEKLSFAPIVIKDKHNIFLKDKVIEKTNTILENRPEINVNVDINKILNTKI